MSDFSFLDHPLPVESRQSRIARVYRECLERHCEHLKKDAENATTYSRLLVRSGVDANDILQSTEDMLTGALLAVKCLKLEQANAHTRQAAE